MCTAIVATPVTMAPRSAVITLTLFIISIPILCWSLELGVALTPSHLVGLVLVAVGGATWARRRDVLALDVPLAAGLAFVLVAGATVVRVLLQQDTVVVGEAAHLKSIKQFVGLGFGVAVMLATTVVLRVHRLSGHALRVHYWTTVTFAAFAFVQYGIAIADLASPLANLSVHNSTFGPTRPLSLMYGFPRISVTLVEPSVLATYLMSGWAFWLYALDDPPFATRRAGLAFTWSGVLLGAAVVISGSRLAYGVFAVLVVGALALRPARLQRLALVCMTLLLGLLLTGPQQGGALLTTLLPKPPPVATVEATAPTTPVAAANATEAPVTADAPERAGTLPERSEPVAPGMTSANPAAAATESPSMVGAAAERVESAAGTLDVSVQQRAASYLVALEALRERPLMGVGFGLSSFAMERYWPTGFLPLPVERVAAATMMSQYATIATEMGLVGIICLAAFGLGIIRQLVGSCRSSQAKRAIAWGTAGALAGYCLSGVATSLVLYQFLLVWLLLALAMSVTHALEDARPVQSRFADAMRQRAAPATAPSSRPAR